MIRSGCCVIALWAGLLAGAPAATPPDWILPAFPERAVFTPDTVPGGYTLLFLSAEKTVNGSLAVRQTGGDPAPFRIVHAGPDSVAVLIRAGTNRVQRPMALYLNGRVKGDAGEDALRNPLPVGLEIYRAPGQGIPETWERMRYLFATTARRQEFEYLENFQEESIAGQGQQRGRKRGQEHRWLIRMRTWLLVSGDGPYRLAVQSRNSTFVLLDGRLVTSRTSDAREGEWTTGAPVVLRAGVYRLDVYHCSGPALSVRLGWQVPGAAGVVPVPLEALVTSGEAVEPRLERMDRAINPDFGWDMEAPYAVQDGAVVFVPVRFKNRSANRLSPDMQFRWDFGDGNTSSEPAPHHVYHRPGLWRVTLSARDAMGFSAACERRVDTSLAEPKRIRIGGRVEALPAVCFGSDVVQPRCRVEGDPGSFTDLILHARLWQSGKESTVRLPVVLPATWSPAISNAGDWHRLEWTLMHRDVPLTAGSVQVQVPPLSAAGLSVNGQSLWTARGEQVVLMPWAPNQAVRRSPWPLRAQRRIAVVGEGPVIQSLSRQGVHSRWGKRNGSNEGIPPIQVVALPDWSRDPNVYGPLLKLVETPAAVPAGARGLLVCLGFSDWLAGTDPRVFERQVAALSDGLLGDVPLMWVTPPPAGDTPGAMRPYVEAIVRTAYVRGIPVADLYSAFTMTDQSIPLLDDTGLALTRAGEHLMLRVLDAALAAASEDLP